MNIDSKSNYDWCAIGLGSNLGDRLAILTGAIERLKMRPQIELLAVSSWYRTAPIGPPQPDYLNGCATIETSLTPLELLNVLQSIEAEFGRVRQEVWGARTLDLDLLLCGDWIIDSPTLQVPHPYICDRAFVLVPLAQIAPDIIEPKSGESIANLSKKLECTGVKLIEN
ncbi:2-amino-4-hydroxy-6-hydroxymethyldihydropteridine diphosphokinase [Chamaesiphon sp. VAR_69_metabat_338]|uniref:2-amino-4-hydroxy-6- hydroxymethyldihydropteridine diphosphokinase n=1 Tax=Chamaesiphon sp. VAR_69_metabat_338 TaxID=2964704 RepID=UPI00286D7A58|nr:2-amino-4-hydroxy-6-hydroxymethyldihydropteridine diphosphokinase [Chamaesiphon sp. VAR_69_metabat_338]